METPSSENVVTIPEGINSLANSISNELDARVIVYSGDIDVDGFGQLLQAVQPSPQQPNKANTLLFLTTWGGGANPAYRIASLLQSISEKFVLCVPAECRSAGTIIALGASELFLTGLSVLGPLDPQLRQRDEIGQRRSGMVVRTALDGLAEETFKVYERVMLGITVGSQHAISFDVASRIAARIATGVMSPVYAQISPQALGNDLRDLAVATAYGQRLIEKGKNATKETIRKLVEDYPTHDFIIDIDEARKLFSTVNFASDDCHKLIAELGSITYVVQSPHVIRRLDGDFEHSEESTNGQPDTNENPRNKVARGREETRRSDHKQRKKADEPAESKK